MIFRFGPQFSLIAYGWFVCLDPTTEFANSGLRFSNRAATFPCTQHPTARESLFRASRGCGSRSVKNRGSVRATQAEKLGAAGPVRPLGEFSLFERTSRPGVALQTPGVSHARAAEIGGFLGLHCPRYPARPLDVALRACQEAHTPELFRHFLCKWPPHERS